MTDTAVAPFRIDPPHIDAIRLRRILPETLREPVVDGVAEHYWPAHALHAFTLQMAACGHCVSASMMLGDGEYAREQLRHARCLGDSTLRALAGELADFFDAMPPADFALPVQGGRHAGQLA